jgi:hypothetical protein
MAAQTFSSHLKRWANAYPDEIVLRWLFGAVLSATVAVIGLDYYEMLQTAPEQSSFDPTAPSNPMIGPKPSAEPLPARRGGDRRGAPLRQADASLTAKMMFELVGDGRLIATGTIMPGTADAFAAEIGKRGGYVKSVVLHSPGGSVQDALRMGRLIREKKFATEVENGKYCASSCPLVFAGGIERRAGEKSAIGVHQIFSVTEAGLSLPNGDQAQRVSAQCQRYLSGMGVDLQVWVHAMETPKDELFYFKSEELLTLKLATNISVKLLKLSYR